MHKIQKNRYFYKYRGIPKFVNTPIECKITRALKFETGPSSKIAILTTLFQKTKILVYRAEEHLQQETFKERIIE